MNRVDKAPDPNEQRILELDPELSCDPQTRGMVAMSAVFMDTVTKAYGSPDAPLWHEGTVEQRPMTYHNGGEDGHTSVGELGAGVPRGALQIALAVNRAAGREVYSPADRAVGLCAAAAHDVIQNCGRTLLPEGKGEQRGDERLSAEIVRTLAGVFGDDRAQQAYDGVMATAFNPHTKTQNIDYGRYNTAPGDLGLRRSLLTQELVAGADLISLTHPRGVVGSVENCVEVLASNAKGRFLQKALRERGTETQGVADMTSLLDVIGESSDLRGHFTELMDGQARFFDGFQFSDWAIRLATAGKGIDDLFPGRPTNVSTLQNFHAALQSGEMSPRQVWEQARTHAGYTN